MNYKNASKRKKKRGMIKEMMLNREKILVNQIKTLSEYSSKYQYSKQLMMKLLTSKEWLKLKTNLFSVFDKKCFKCGSKRSIEVCHVKEASSNPELSLDMTNIQILCKGCSFSRKIKTRKDLRTQGQINTLNTLNNELKNEWIKFFPKI